jgi:hypothetical protein
VNKFLWKKMKKKNPQESCVFLFFSPKNKFLSKRNYQPSQDNLYTDENIHVLQIAILDLWVTDTKILQ